MFKQRSLRFQAILGTAVGAALVIGTGGATSALGASNTAAAYTISTGAVVPFAYPTDTPANPFIDKDGTFYFQQSNANYALTDPRQWDFYTGTSFDDATLSSALSNAVNPANPNDKNHDTTWRCNNSPTGVESSYTDPLDPTWYSQRNFCDLSSVWVDPDTGDWYGLVHNEFTPSPFGDGLHFDAIDYAVSKDQGRTWSIKDHAVTSPFSTKRNDKTAFPNQTYYYGDGDQRLVVDTASGYFYLYYSSRVVNQGKHGSWGAFTSHVARAPIAQKMTKGSWQKYYNGGWQSTGIGGQESTLMPVSAEDPNGYLPASQEYNPQNPGSWEQQVAAGKLKASPLFVMNVSYNAYLGKYIGTPQTDTGASGEGNLPLHFYATDDLATQKWTDIGSTPSYSQKSWYRWMVDSATGTTGNILGKTFRSYCSIDCSAGADGKNTDGEYVNVTIDSSNPAASLVDPGTSYLIGSASGQLLTQAGGNGTAVIAAATGSKLEGWKFQNNNDGSYTIVNASSGLALGVNSNTTASRAWGTKPTVSTPITGNVGQQWFIQKVLKTPSSGASTPTGSYQLVNRYSGLVLSLGSTAQTSPFRNWANNTGSASGSKDVSADQTLTLTAVVDSIPPGAVLKVNPATVVPGQNVLITGVGFAPNAKINLALHSEPIELGTVLTDAHGNFSKTLAIPKTTSLGKHRVIATGADQKTLAAELTVIDQQTPPAATSAPGKVVPAAGQNPGGSTTNGANTPGTGEATSELANTGVSPGLWALGGIGGGVLALGAAATILARRRRPAR